MPFPTPGDLPDPGIEPVSLEYREKRDRQRDRERGEREREKEREREEGSIKFI